jgi:hypothetical protein
MRTLDRNQAHTDRQSSPRAPDFLDAVPTRERATTGTATYGRVLFTARILGALTLAAVGAVHLQQYSMLYSQIPTIGTLFVLNFAAAIAIAIAILAPLERIGGRYGRALVTLAAAAGIAIAAVSFVFLFISERTRLFGFMEPGYDPTAINVARATEVATVLLLGGYLIGRAARKSSTQKW